MAENSKIEWTDATFNPWQGCTKVSPGCDHCYAEARQDTRLHAVKWGAGQPRKRTSASNWREPHKWNSYEFCECPACGWRGEERHAKKQEVGFIRSCCPRCDGEALRGARRRVFCASLADVFDNEVDPAWRRDLFLLIMQTPQLDWLLLTKRVGNVKAMMAEITLDGHPMVRLPPNVWLGATIVNQEEADRDIPKLLVIPAAVRFVSMEPLLGPVDLPGMLYCGTERSGGVVPLRSKGYEQIDWVIVGGESGPGARPMHPDWPRSLRDQCAAAGAPFLFKQHGEWAPIESWEPADKRRQCGIRTSGAPMPDDEWLEDGQRFKLVGKKSAGRLLDGVEHNGYPAPR